MMIQYLIMKSSLNHKISKEKKRFQAYLVHNEVEMTSGRIKVFDEVMGAHGHFTAEELAKSCGAKKHVSRATVYRVIKELLEAGIIRETAFGDKHHHFEHIYDEKPHHHAKCIRCYEFLQFPDLKEDEVYRPYLEKQGFKVLGHEMHFYGICKKCQE